MRDSQSSLDLAYEFVRDSYDWMLRRMDALERRIDSLLLFVATLTFAIPTATIALSGSRQPLNGLDFSSWHILCAMAALACFLVATIVGLRVRGWGQLRLIILEKLLAYQETKTKDEFQRHMIEFAGDQLKDNLAFIACKARWADALSCLLVLEFLLWIPWSYHTLS